MANPPTSKTLPAWPFWSQSRCGLLVSVRDAQEAGLILRHGVEIMDLKEPSAGALGTVSDSVILQVQQLTKKVIAEKRPKLSFALGELTDWDFGSYPRLLDRYCLDMIAGMSYVKIGLAGADQLQDWQSMWRELFAGLPEKTQPVVVAYLDRLPSVSIEQTTDVRAESTTVCPDIEQLIEFAEKQPRVSTILLDTCDKHNNLFASVDEQRLQEIIAAAKRASLTCVVAGSVDGGSLPTVLQAGASMVGVRGAVCDGDRNGELCEQKLIEFRGRLAGSLQSHGERISVGLGPDGISSDKLL